MQSNPRIAILLSTYNGEEFIHEQIDSLFSQNIDNIDVIVRDDKSMDGTVKILKSYKSLNILDSDKNLGVIGSFEKLLKSAVDYNKYDYYMFCDQDDIWEYNKIERTLIKMQELEKRYGFDIPILVHTDLTVVNDQLEMISESMWDYNNIEPSENSFNKLLVQNTVTGCTMMINKKLAVISLPFPSGIIMHDWWFALISSKFGRIEYINDATIKYRQHTLNEIGAKRFGFGYIMSSIFNLKKIDVVKYFLQADAFLKKYEKDLDVKSKVLLNDFISIQRLPLYKKIINILRYKFFKQNFIRTIGWILKV